MDRLRAAARGQRGGRRNVRFNMTLADGRVVEVGARGGYAVSSVLTRAKGEGNDPLGWLTGEIASRIYLDGVSPDIVQDNVTVF